MLRRLRWVALVTLALIGAYALAGSVLSSRFDGRMAAFRASEAFADLERRAADIPPDENAVPLFADAAAALDQVPEEHAMYALAWAYDPDNFERICIPPPSEDGEKPFDGYEREREEMRSALPSLDPFVAALAAALERTAVQFPTAWSEAEDIRRFATNMLPFRARLLPDRAAESGDLLLRLGTKWRIRDASDPLNRHEVVREALGVVRHVLSTDARRAAPYASTWREMLAAEDPLALFRFQCANSLRSLAEVTGKIRRGVDPNEGVRESLQKVREKLGDVPAEIEPKLTRLETVFETPWTCRWYARPILYWSSIAAMDAWTSAIESARTEAGLRKLLRTPGLDRITGIVGVRMLEAIAFQRLAETALAASAGDPLPELENPFTGRPLLIRRAVGAVVIEAELPEAFRDRVESPGLLTWEVRR